MRRVLFGALVLGAWLGASVAVAQIQPMARPRSGFVELRTGFRPDPLIMNGQMGGSAPASQLGGNCRGQVFPQPSHIVRTPTGFRRIRFVVSGQGDSTLVVMLPNGQVLCDDDGGGSLNPLIDTPSPPGDIRVWVGVYAASAQNQPYTIGVTELPNITFQNLGGGGIAPPPPQAGGINPNAAPLYGTVQLRSGFMPDPHVVAGMAGGPMAASQLNNSCRGFVTPQPSQVLMSPTGFRTLRIAVNGTGLDTTLMVMTSNGQVFCDDDGGSDMQPLVTVNGAPPGPIRVWVGVYSQGRNGPYNIGFSELSNVGTQSIPAPGGGQVVVRPNPNTPVQPPPPAGEVVPMQVGIPVTLMGPGMDGNTIALWRPSGGTPQRVTYSGRTIMAGEVQIAALPSSMADPIVTVVQQRNGQLVARAEQPPAGARDRGQAMVFLVRFDGRPVVADQWTGTAVQRGPRWTR